MFLAKAPTGKKLMVAGFVTVMGLALACSSQQAMGSGAESPRSSTNVELPGNSGDGNQVNETSVPESSGGIVGSGGETIKSPSGGSTGSGVSGGEAGSGSNEPDLGEIIEAPGEWLTYIDDSYGFSISYPDTLVVLPEPSTMPESTPSKAHRVRFQDRSKAEGQFADLEPVHFAVEVFELDQPVTLQDWLEENGLLPDYSGPGVASLVESVELENSGEGLHVRLPVLLAPNEYYYFASDDHVYRLIPLGNYSKDMMDSFVLP